MGRVGCLTQLVGVGGATRLEEGGFEDVQNLLFRAFRIKDKLAEARSVET